MTQDEPLPYIRQARLTGISEGTMNKRTHILWLVLALPACASIKDSRQDASCDFCPAMVVVPAGTAIVGAAEHDPFKRDDELPELRIAVPAPFEVSRYEVTRGQYEAFVRATGREVGGDCLTDRTQRGNWVIDANTTFRDPGFTQSDTHPVACVSWEEARAYVAWLNSETSGGYRLLTETEWEYVARSGTNENLVYPWGNEADAGCAYANGFDQTTVAAYAGVDRSGYRIFDPMRCSDGLLNTAPVGSLRPNAFGIYDIIGNVSEWVEDCYSPTRKASADETCAKRVAKGGSWGTLAHNFRIAERLPYAATHRDDSIGIRVARTILAGTAP